MSKNIILDINGKNVTVIKRDSNNYICLTEIVEAYSGGTGSGTIDRWLSNKNTIGTYNRLFIDRFGMN